MKNRPSEVSSQKVPHFVSPCCRSVLIRNDSQLMCRDCGSKFLIEDGLYKFSVEESQHGELSTLEMKNLVEKARSYGWKRALEDIDIPEKEKISSLIYDPRRRTSVSLLAGLGGKVLDFGCGYGGVTIALSKIFDEVVSLDGAEGRVSFLNVMRQQEEMANVTTVCHMDVLNLPFPDDYFDAIVLVGVLEYLPETVSNDTISVAHRKCLESFFRVLRPGGRMLVHTKNRFGWQFLMGGKDHSGLRFAPVLPIQLADWILRLKGRGSYRIINYSYSGYIKLFSRAGFKTPKLYWPYPGYQAPYHIIDLSGNISGQLKEFISGKVSYFKYVIFQILSLVKILKRVVPYYTLVAIKPADDGH